MTGAEKMLEAEAGVARWLAIARALEGEIASGTLPAGARLPPEPDLAGRFGVNRHTLRRAVAHLVEKGLVSVEQGRGTFVRDQVIDYPIGPRTRFSEIIGAQSHDPVGQFLASETAPPPADIARRLGLADGVPAHRIDSLHLADEVPISLASNWFPSDRFPDVVARFAETGSVSRALAAHGVPEYRRVESRITARLPSRADADHLRQPPTQPVIVVESVNVDPAGVPIQASRTRFAAARVQFIVRPQ